MSRHGTLGICREPVRPRWHEWCDAAWVRLCSQALSVVFAGVAACSGIACQVVQVDEALDDDPQRYIEDVHYRRGIVERDLTDRGNEYAAMRLEQYGVEGFGWELLAERDPPSRPLRAHELDGLQDGAPLTLDPGQGASLSPANIPEADAEWIALGRRVFFDYPLRADGIYETLVRVPGALEESGFLVDGENVIGLAIFADQTGIRLGSTCAQCHAGRGEDGAITAILANKSMDLGRARLLAMGITPEELPSEIDSTLVADLHRLGPGRSDVMSDDEFNPFALPDLGGIAQFPYLQHNANWVNRGVATLAVRCETLFITGSGEQTRIPRVLSWALAMYLRSLPPPAPVGGEATALVERGRQVFEGAACGGCHSPPLYTSDRDVTVDEIGTDRAALASSARGTGFVRIPSLRGVGRTAPYFHHGAVPDLETLFDPSREEPGHRFGLEIEADDRDALIAFLRSI